MPLTMGHDRFVVFAANILFWTAQAYRASHADFSMLCIQLPAHVRQLHPTVCMSAECAFQMVVPLLLCCWSFAFGALHVLHNRIVCASPSWHFHGGATLPGNCCNFLIITIILIILAVIATFLPKSWQSP